MKQKVSKLQATALILDNINRTTEATVEMHENELSNMNIDEKWFRKICYGFYLDCARYGLIYFQKFKGSEEVELTNFLVDKIAEAKFNGDGEDKGHIFWVVNQLFEEVDDVFASFNKPLADLQKMYENCALDGYHSQEDKDDAGAKINFIFHTFGRDIIHWLHKDIKIK